MPYDFSEEAELTNKQLTPESDSIFSKISNHCPWRIQIYHTIQNSDGENIWHECRATESKCNSSDCAIMHFQRLNEVA